MKTSFAYVRVSTVKQGEGVSLDAQRDAIIAFAERNGITISKWFVEKETAAKCGRPEFNAMLRALKRRQADGVVLHKVDRGARNAFDWARIGQLSDAGVDVHFAAESLDFRSRGGRLTADIQAVIAADYIRNLREETIKGLYGRLKQGLYPFNAPIGYRDNGGGKPKTVDPVRGPLVKRALELYASGQHSIHSLRAEMQRLGLRNAHGRPLSKGAVEWMLSNPFYAGIIRIRRNGQVFQGIHEPLISPDTFRTIQAVKAGKSGKKITRHRHVYRGLFRCRHCGRAMIPELQKGHVYYRCQRRGCPANCIREEALERAVTESLRHIVLPERTIAEITEAVERWASRHSGTLEFRTATLQLQNLERRLESMTDALVDGLIDKESFGRRKETLLLQQAELCHKLAKANAEPITPQMVRRFLERARNVAEHYMFADPEERRQIIDIATSNRTVADKNVYLEPSNWLKPAHAALAVLYGCPPRPASRRGPKLQDEPIEALVKAARSEAWARLSAIIERHEARPDPGAKHRRLHPFQRAKRNRSGDPDLAADGPQTAH